MLNQIEETKGKQSIEFFNRSIIIRKKHQLTSGQSYKQFTLVNYDSRVVVTQRNQSLT